MNRQEALRIVANNQAGLLETEEFEGQTGLGEWEVSDADRKRLEWAIGEVSRRLRAMGESRRAS